MLHECWGIQAMKNLTTSHPGKRKQERKKKEAVSGCRMGGLETASASPKLIGEEKCIADNWTQGWTYRN